MELVQQVIAFNAELREINLEIDTLQTRIVGETDPVRRDQLIDDLKAAYHRRDHIEAARDTLVDQNTAF